MRLSRSALAVGVKGLTGGSCKGKLSQPQPLQGELIFFRPAHYGSTIARAVVIQPCTLTDGALLCSSGAIRGFLQGYAISRGVIVKCHVIEACLGGQDSLCGPGYRDNRCGECADGYYKMSRSCRECSSDVTTVILLVVLVLAGVLGVAFFEWQTMRDPRIGSPIVIVMRLLETLGILSLAAARWPGSIPIFLSTAALVNLNTEVFQTECVLGRPHPTRTAMMYVLGVAVLLFVLLLFYPFLQLIKRCVRFDRGESPSLDSMCEMLMPDKVAPGTPLPFSAHQALMLASFKEYVKIAFAVSLPSRA